MIITLTGTVEPETEDSGASKIAFITDVEGHPDDGLHVRIHSWDETLRHPLMTELTGKKVRVTIETVDEQGQAQ